MKNAIIHYHPDRQNVEKHGKKWKVLCEEITKILTSRYESHKIPDANVDENENQEQTEEQTERAEEHKTEEERPEEQQQPEETRSSGCILL